MLNLIHFYRLGHFLWKCKIPLLPKIIEYIQFLVFNSYVPCTASIGRGTRFAYGGIAVVIHKNATIGENCMIGQGVTIGGKSKSDVIPKLGNNVYLGAGCRVLGPIVIGNDVLIGPNSVVVKNVPSNVIIVGIPSKIIRENIKVRDFV